MGSWAGSQLLSSPPLRDLLSLSSSGEGFSSVFSSFVFAEVFVLVSDLAQALPLGSNLSCHPSAFFAAFPFWN